MSRAHLSITISSICGHVCIGLQGCTTKIFPFLWVKPNSSWKFPDYFRAHLSTTYSTLCSHSVNMLHRSFNQFKIHWSCSLTSNNLKWSQNHGSGVHMPRYFHTTHSVINYPHQIHFPFQMSWPTIAKCYDEIAKDLTLLHLFLPLEAYSSIQALLCWGDLQFRLVLEFFTCIASSDKWEKAGVEFHTLTSQKMSGEPPTWQSSSPMEWARGDLGLVMVFCHPNQAKDGGLWCPFCSMPTWLIKA